MKFYPQPLRSDGFYARRGVNPTPNPSPPGEGNQFRLKDKCSFLFQKKA
jgi:hypothetical protein